MPRQLVVISIPSPCNESWDEMPAVPGGRHCSTCAKKVVDYTLMTDVELVAFIQANPVLPCGQFRDDQLNREIVVKAPERPYLKISRRVAAAMILMGGLGTTAAAQVVRKTAVSSAVVPRQHPDRHPESADSSFVKLQVTAAFPAGSTAKGCVVTVRCEGQLLGIRDVVQDTVFSFRLGRTAVWRRTVDVDIYGPNLKGSASIFADNLISQVGVPVTLTPRIPKPIHRTAGVPVMNHNYVPGRKN